ncbi:unnamed protein product [Parnassius apollo]|uniref:(apollo) hypothetical protein n=1 Tax=Parnassius apollo TaxID=110799 RepID=A0A8S3XCA8_PARAO|nr:unnamed protein product [Parnassius apollo]
MSEDERVGHRELLQDFIESYRNETCLWKTTSKDYHDRNKKCRLRQANRKIQTQSNSNVTRTQSTTGIGSTSYDCPDSDRDTPTLAYSDNESDTPTPEDCSNSERATSI